MTIESEFNYRSCLGDSDLSDLGGETTRQLTGEEAQSMLENSMIDSLFESECRRRLGRDRDRKKVAAR
jgi:hypothetical protein